MRGKTPHALMLLGVLACDRPGSDGPEATGSGSPELAALSRGDREARLREACYTLPACGPGQTTALLESAPEADRKALREFALKALVAEVQMDLAKRHRTVVKLGHQGRQITIEGVCNKPILENFIDTPGRHARLLGIEQVSCSSKALKATAYLP